MVIIISGVRVIGTVSGRAGGLSVECRSSVGRVSSETVETDLPRRRNGNNKDAPRLAWQARQPATYLIPKASTKATTKATADNKPDGSSGMSGQVRVGDDGVPRPAKTGGQRHGQHLASVMGRDCQTCSVLGKASSGKPPGVDSGSPKEVKMKSSVYSVHGCTKSVFCSRCGRHTCMHGENDEMWMRIEWSRG